MTPTRRGRKGDENTKRPAGVRWISNWLIKFLSAISSLSPLHRTEPQRLQDSPSLISFKKRKDQLTAHAFLKDLLRRTWPAIRAQMGSNAPGQGCRLWWGELSQSGQNSLSNLLDTQLMMVEDSRGFVPRYPPYTDMNESGPLPSIWNIYFLLETSPDIYLKRLGCTYLTQRFCTDTRRSWLFPITGSRWKFLSSDIYLAPPI